ncbi:MAG TPA: tetratricopeptide repeat protein [Chitinophagales bacterium]|nr:tetratricopeptide repeat protein [Chitinophagales bacterium]
MRIKQVILLIAGVLMVVLLFEFGVTKAPKQPAVMPPAAGSGNGSVSPVDFSVILEKAKGTLNDGQRDSIESLELQLKKVRGDKEKASMLEAIAAKWEKTGNVLVAGKYFEEASSITNDKNTLKKSANLFYTGFPTTTDSLARVFGAQEGIKAFHQLSKLDSTNYEYPIHEAVCYVDGLGQVMPGVSLLKKVEQKDPDNLEMNLILGKLAVVSGQYDKAITRLKKVTSLDPTNAEAYFHLAEAYQAVGKKDDAIKSLEQCKTLVKDPAFSARIDSYIQKIKNP